VILLSVADLDTIRKAEAVEEFVQVDLGGLRAGIAFGPLLEDDYSLVGRCGGQ
jgi:hypothetical protein